MTRRILTVAALLVIAIVVLLVLRESRPEDPAAQPFQRATDRESTEDTALARIESGTEPTRGLAVTPVAPIAGTGRTAEVAPRFALVKVRVVEKGTHAPLAGALAYASADTPDEDGRAIAESTGSRGGLLQFTTTDADGRVEIEAPPDVEITVHAQGPDLGVGSASEPVPPVRAGSTFELVLELARRDDLVFWCRVVDERTRVPIAGARVVSPLYGAWGGHDTRALAETDAAGLLTLRVTSFSPSVLELDARARGTEPGHGIAYFVSEIGHETADRALELALPESAWLHARILDESGTPVRDASVSLTTKPWYLAKPDGGITTLIAGLRAPLWRNQTDADGRTELLELPPLVKLRAEVGMGRVLWKNPDPLVLEPGEVRDVEWKVGYGCKVTGRIVDQFGKPVARHVLRMETTTRKEAAYLQSYPAGTVKTTRSDADGRFEFLGIEAGTWWIGPAPVSSKPPEADEVAPIACVIEIRADETEREVELRVDRGLTIRGTVLDSKGNPSRGGYVDARSQTDLPQTGANFQRGGTFTIGPLAAGRYELRAQSHGLGSERDATSEPVGASAGDENVVLRLREGVALAGRVVDVDGAPVAASLAVTQPGSRTFGAELPETKPDGTFRVANLEPGTFAISATHPDGRVGMLEHITLERGQEATDLVVRLAPGGRVRVHYDGLDHYGAVSILRGDALVGLASFERGTAHEFSAPLGTVTVQLRLHGVPRTVERTIEVKAGTRAEVVFDEDAR